jgi:lipoprotein-anchoring transpeptidase ErfK/SrfK
MIRVGEHRASVAARRLWRIAVLAAAGALGATSDADAALYYWSDFDPGYYRPGPTFPQQRRPRTRHRQTKKIEASEKESTKPQGPLVIAISIDRQSLKVYDANGFFAETSISTGMKGHPTPMGVFSIIQKHKFHHSNIYSGAPMPYMQRITWSGVAMHAGVLPGYPASHGCIRMPMAFAMKMWNWTKMGARVVVTPGEITPSSFSHPLLAARKVVPQPAAEPQADVPPAPKSDKASEADTPVKPVTSGASLELRSTVGHGDGAKADIAKATALRDQIHTAEAGVYRPASKAAVTMTDAAPSAGNASPREEAATDNPLPTLANDVTPKAGDASSAETTPEAAKSETARSEPEPATIKQDETASSDEKPAETKSSAAPTAEIKPAPTDSADGASKKSDEVQALSIANGHAAKLDTTPTGTSKPEAKAAETKPELKADEVKADTSKPAAPKSAEKPDASVKAATDAATGVPDAKKDQDRLPGAAKTASKPDQAIAPKRTGQIAALISRKDSKLYVRQNFAPLFDVPVTIAPSDRPLGTHVFTARVDKDDANILHWSVVSLPVSRHAERRDEDDRASRRRKITGAVETKPVQVQNSPAEALDRLTIPADAMARITEALSTGGSIIVSDQGVGAGETGEGTDFIVSLR